MTTIQQRIPRRGRSADVPVYVQETRGITVRVTPSFLPEQSSRERGRYVWAYTVEIENRSTAEVQLVSRHWIITDALNRTEEVKGAGVVGEQPELKPGEAYRYASACPLTTPSGIMRGSYRMVTPEGDTFEVHVPQFSLDLPDARKRMN
ncbi:MAG: Co2+/Mg2+ efflux protein ApaG [Caulobacteraceae bacterium]|jgi:ApaG protein|nr:Co2+/Mg2+ efflux protein ApaG [Caulobacteraceae bacterium]